MTAYRSDAKTGSSANRSLFEPGCVSDVCLSREARSLQHLRHGFLFGWDDRKAISPMLLMERLLDLLDRAYVSHLSIIALSPKMASIRSSNSVGKPTALPGDS